jgi:hypothetical protein
MDLIFLPAKTVNILVGFLNQKIVMMCMIGEKQQKIAMSVTK